LVEIVLQYNADPSRLAQWWHPWGTWVLSAKHLAIPFATLLVSVSVLVRRATALSPLHVLALGEFVALSLLWCAWQTFGRTALDWEYFAFPLIPQTFLAIAALLHVRSGELPRRAVALAPLALAAALTLNIASVVQPFGPDWWPTGGALTAALVCVLAGSSLLLRRQVGLAAFIPLCALGNAFAAAAPIRYAFVNPCPTSGPFQAAVIATHRYVAETDPALEDVTIWFEEGEQIDVGRGCQVNLGYLGYALAASGIPYLANPFPLAPIEDISDEAIEEVTRPRRTLVVLSADPSAERRVMRRLETIGIRAAPLQYRSFTLLAGRFSVWLLGLETADKGVGTADRPSRFTARHGARS
jgi:hypothetical protein